MVLTAPSSPILAPIGVVGALDRLQHAARSLDVEVAGHLPDLHPLHEAVAASCTVNGPTKQADWQAYERAIAAWRYFFNTRWEQRGARTVIRALIRPDDGSAAAALAAFLPFCWLFGTVPAPAQVGLVELPALPFIPYPYQETVAERTLQLMLEPPDQGRDLGIIKGRQTGLTTLFVHLFDWLWLITPHLTMGLGSRAQSEVDVNPGSQNPHSLIGRAETIIMHLPDWLHPAHFDLADKTMRQMGQWINSENGARLDGEASSPHFSRSRTYMVLLIDEWAMWPDAEAVLAASAPNVKLLRIFLTTPLPDQPAVEAFYERMAETWPHRIIEIQSWEHPTRDAEWEQAERARLGDKLYAQEHELSFQADAERVIYPEWRSVTQGDVGFMPDWPLVGGIDFGRRDGTALIVGQVNPDTNRVRLLASHFSSGQTIYFYLPLLGALARQSFTYSQDEWAWIDQIQRWLRQTGGMTWYGDPAGEQLTQIADSSVAQVIRQNGIHLVVNEKVRSHEERQSATRQLLRNCEATRDGIRSLDAAMRKYRWPKLNQLATNAPRRAPVHRDSHLPTALEYLAVNADQWASREGTQTTLTRRVAGWERWR